MSHKLNDIFWEQFYEMQQELHKNAPLDKTNQLRKNLLNLVEKHPELYTIEDYFNTCKKLNILVF